MTPRTYLARTAAALAAIDAMRVERLIAVIRTIIADRTLYVCGNGGSYTTALHLAADLGRYYRVICLGANAANLTRIANDRSYANVFEEEYDRLSVPGDAVLLLSVSGMSPNVLQLTIRDDASIRTLGIFGASGAGMAEHCAAAVVVPSQDYGIVETCHLAICHQIVEALRP